MHSGLLMHTSGASLLVSELSYVISLRHLSTTRLTSLAKCQYFLGVSSNARYWEISLTAIDIVTDLAGV